MLGALDAAALPASPLGATATTAAAAAGPTQLKLLDLTFCPITDEAVKAVACGLLIRF